MPNYPNPYDFVPLEATPPVRRKLNVAKDGFGQYHIERYSGRLHCILSTKTPLFIHGAEQQKEDPRRFFRQNHQLCIPASSLKGELRSIYEIVSNSCLSTLSDPFQNSRQVPTAYQPCSTLTDACPACLLFGMTERDQTQDATALAGRLIFSDALPARLTTSSPIQIPEPRGGPQTRHRSFYFSSSGHILGRKLYYHHRNYQQTIDEYRGRKIKVEAQSGDFTFQLDFHNLSESELLFLIYTVVLEPHLCHHIGYAKPYGLGSVQIKISQIDWWQRPKDADGLAHQHFLTWQPDMSAEDPTAWLSKQVEKTLGLWGKRLNGQYDPYGKFEYILTWPGRTLYQYPDHHWFRTSGVGQISLDQYQRGVRSPNNRGTP